MFDDSSDSLFYRDHSYSSSTSRNRSYPSSRAHSSSSSGRRERRRISASEKAHWDSCFRKEQHAREKRLLRDLAMLLLALSEDH